NHLLSAPTDGSSKAPPELKGPLEAGASLVQSALPPVGVCEPGQAVGLPRDVPQLGEDGIAVREMRNCLGQPVLAPAQVTQAAQQRCLGMAVAGRPGGAKSNLGGALPLLPAGGHLEEGGEQPRQRLPPPPTTLPPRPIPPRP